MTQHTHDGPGAGAHGDDAPRTHADHSARADLPIEGMSCASCAARIERYSRAAMPRAASRSGARTSNTLTRFMIGSGIARASFAVATQITWLASTGTSANSSVNWPAVSCSSRL